jgi:hypothetical protein
VHLFEDCNLCAIHAKRVTISEYPCGLDQASSGRVKCSQAVCMSCVQGPCVHMCTSSLRTCANACAASES